ncbi:hypothetical protein jhhlp_000193 [Lomentospora prolificans]|uniref:Uncharacterized protein n=1 Tax=Lomentospora prolificans TaxID=41688 RepID=A0A2N3NK90_9PEZI|nr:hypothetical protein jhhlp_000193 [Lomentospora prolificans]
MAEAIFDGSGSEGFTTFQASLATVCLTLISTGVPSIILSSERFFDASGTLAFLVACASSFPTPCLEDSVDYRGTRPWAESLIFGVRNGVGGLLQAGGCVRGVAFDGRQAILTGVVAMWATRLGFFLLFRILREGRDSRFDGIRESPVKFTVAWVGQLVWVGCCAMPVIWLNSVPAQVFARFPGFSAFESLGLALALAGFAVEVVADWQKSKWSREKHERKHDEKFISRGLFSQSRYPHYFGDILFWFGVATFAFGSLWREEVVSALGLPGGVVGGLIVLALTYISPAFAYFLLTRVSGIPLSEAKYDRAYGHDENYRVWRHTTPRLVPKILWFFPRRHE